jgi:imidazolonepropionase
MLSRSVVRGGAPPPGANKVLSMPRPYRPHATLAFRHALVATCDATASDAGLVPDGAVAVSDRLIGWVGPDARLEAEVDLAGAEVVDAAGRLLTPGLVDSHTHLVFAGDRSGEMAARCAGRSYLEIAMAGGGIMSTVSATASASDEDLLAAAMARARRLLAQGVTTIEVKSGYGLEVDAELRLLRVIAELAHALWSEVTVVPTLLAAHAVPPGRAHDRAGYLRDLCQALIPAASAERLAAFCDAFTGEGAFSLDEARAVLEAGARHRLVPRVHAEQLGPDGGARLAADLGCASADHLEHVDAGGTEALAQAGVVAGLLPVSTLYLGQSRFAPARALLAAGAQVALATNLNPGTAMNEDVNLTLSLACISLRMTPAEALVAMTAGGARALRRPEVGHIARGCEADLVLWGCRSVEHLPWHMGVPHALTVVKRGRAVHRAGPETADCA